MKFISRAIMATLVLPVLATMPLAAMAQPTGGLMVPLEVPDGSTFVLFGPHWGQKATVTGRQVPVPPSGSYGNFQLPDGSWYPVSVTPPSGWHGTIMGGRCNGSCPAGVNSATFALIAR